MKTLKIKWQRLIYGGGKTCRRCGATGNAVRNAVKKLKTALKPLGIKVSLEEKTLSAHACAKDISQSNRIWVAEEPLEKWLGARAGKSPCSTCCENIGKNVECRTLKLAGKTYEAIPVELVLRAGLIAAAEIIKKESAKASCCKPR